MQLVFGENNPVQSMDIFLQAKMHFHSYLVKGQYAEVVPSIHYETSGIRLAPCLD